MILQFSFLFYHVCAKNSILSIAGISLSRHISVVLFDFDIILLLRTIYNVLRSNQMSN